VMDGLNHFEGSLTHSREDRRDAKFRKSK
jgi:hypothetical protein